PLRDYHDQLDAGLDRLEHRVARERWRHRHHAAVGGLAALRSEEHTSELQSPCNLVCRLLLEKKKIVSNPLDAMCQVAIRRSVFPKHRFVGMALVLDSARMRFFLAESLYV